MADTNTIRVLDLTTDTPRPTVAIDKIEYPLRGGDDLTLEEYRYLERVTPRAGELLEKTPLTHEEGAELEAYLERIVPLAVQAPEEILAKLKPIQRLMIFQTFMTLSTPAILAAARALERGNLAAAAAASGSSGRRQSRGSSGSIPAPAAPARGRTKRR
jgi:hypothetical protein